MGAGAFGRNHLRNLRELTLTGVAELVGVVEPGTDARNRVVADFGVTGYATLAELVAAPSAGQTSPPIDAAVVAVPTRAHAAVAEDLLRAGISCLVEKPFAVTIADADRVIDLARSLGLVLQIGQLERFNPAVSAASAVLTRPMFFEAHRLSVFTPRSLDVDVVLDLMIHDLDLVLTMVDSEVSEVRAVGLPVLSRKIDIANARVEFANGCVANFTASRVSTERVRKLRFFQPSQYVSLDFARQDALLIDVSGFASAMALDPNQLQAFAETARHTNTHPTPGLELRKLDVVPGEPLRLELEAFLNSVRYGTEVVVSGEQGRAALELALSIDTAIREHGQKAGLHV